MATLQHSNELYGGVPVQRSTPDCGLCIRPCLFGNEGKKLQWGVGLNQVPLSLLGPGDAQLRRPYPQFSDIKTQTNSGFSNYNSLQFTSKKTFQNGFSYLFNYTWAKVLDVGSGAEPPVSKTSIMATAINTPTIQD